MLVVRDEGETQQTLVVVQGVLNDNKKYAFVFQMYHGSACNANIILMYSMQHNTRGVHVLHWAHRDGPGQGLLVHGSGAR